MVEPSTVQKKSRFWLIFPFVILFLLIAGWSAYWVYAKGQLETGIDQWIADERARGATVEFSSKRLGGYPFRFELDVRDRVLAADLDDVADGGGEVRAVGHRRVRDDVALAEADRRRWRCLRCFQLDSRPEDVLVLLDKHIALLVQVLGQVVERCLAMMVFH